MFPAPQERQAGRKEFRGQPDLGLGDWLVPAQGWLFGQQGVIRVSSHVLEVHTGLWSGCPDCQTLPSHLWTRNGVAVSKSQVPWPSWCSIVYPHFCSWDGKERLQSKANSHLRLIHLSSRPQALGEMLTSLSQAVQFTREAECLFGPGFTLDAESVHDQWQAEDSLKEKLSGIFQSDCNLPW